MCDCTAQQKAVIELMTRRSVLWIVVLVAQSTLGFAGEPEAPAPRFVLEWGKQGTEPGEFHFPIGIAINEADEVFVTDIYNNRVQKFSTEGKFLASFAVPRYPGPVALDAGGNLYITHFGSAKAKDERLPDKVTVHTAAGKLLREWGKTGTGDNELRFPGGIAITRQGHVYVADQTNHRIQVFDRQGKFLFKWGEYGDEPGEFGGKSGRDSRTGGPQFVALDSAGNVWTTESANGRVQKFTAEGKYLLSWGDNENKAGSFGGTFTGFKDRKTNLQGPVGICIDKQDRVWVSAVSGRIQQFSPEGKFLRGFGEEGTKPGQFYAPHAIAFDSRGNLYVVDAFNHRVQKFAVGR